MGQLPSEINLAWPLFNLFFGSLTTAVGTLDVNM